MPLSPFDHHIIRVLRSNQPEPIPVQWISKTMRIPPRTTRYYLSGLERRGLAARPAGVKAGWAFWADPFELHMLETLRRCERDLHGPVLTRVLAARLGMAERTVRFYLHRLEAKGSAWRPHGLRRGYSCALNHTAWRVLDLLRDEARPRLYRTGQVADLVNVPERTAREYLRRLEEAGIVRRPLGPKSGWLVA